MAPSGFHLEITRINLSNFVSTSASSDLTDLTPTRIGSYYCYQTSVRVETKKQVVETKKQRIARIAKEKMLASWKKEQFKTDKIKQVIQVYKPQHRLNHSGKRY